MSSCTEVTGNMQRWDKFPAGLRVMVVDDDKLCLAVIAKMLTKCSYEVVTCSSSSEALSLLREKCDDFDLVLSDVVMPDIDGFKLLEFIALEVDIPVIMMSSNGDTDTVLRGVTHGAVDFLIKPVRTEELRNVWQHVLRKRNQQTCKPELSDDIDAQEQESEAQAEVRKRSRGDGPNWDIDESPNQTGKRPRVRVHWSSEMHAQFVTAVNRLGIEKAVPKKILELMNVEGLTRENVASHLQKYRLYLKKTSRIEDGPNRPFDPNAGGGHMASSDAMMQATSMQCNTLATAPYPEAYTPFPGGARPAMMMPHMQPNMAAMHNYMPMHNYGPMQPGMTQPPVGHANQMIQPSWSHLAQTMSTAMLGTTHPGSQPAQLMHEATQAQAGHAPSNHTSSLPSNPPNGTSLPPLISNAPGSAPHPFPHFRNPPRDHHPGKEHTFLSRNDHHNADIETTIKSEVLDMDPSLLHEMDNTELLNDCDMPDPGLDDLMSFLGKEELNGI